MIFKNIKNVLIILLILFLGYFIYDKLTTEEREIEVPIYIEVPVPSIEGESDTLKNPTPIKIINPINKQLNNKNKELIKENKKLLKLYKEADSILKENKYKDAITIREYEEEFVDTFQTISVFTKTRGSLLEQSISYKTNEYTIPLDTIVTTKVKNKFKVFGSLEVGTILLDEDKKFSNIVVKPGIIFKNSKDNGLMLSVDTNGIVYIGGIIKF